MDQRSNSRHFNAFLMVLVLLLLILHLVAPTETKAQPTEMSARSSVDGQIAKFIDVNGARTRYYDVGVGEVILLIHGARPSGRSSANTWGPVLSDLGERYHVLAPDRLGHGMTENPKSEYTVIAEMDHLYAFLKLLKVDRFYVVGQSTGAYHAARITLEHPEMVKALVLADSATLSPPMGNLQERRAAIGLGTGAGPQSAGSPKEQARAALIALSKNREHITEEFLSAAEYMADQSSGKQTDAAMLTDVAKRYEVIINNGAEEMRLWIKDGKLQTPTLLYWGKNDPSAILPLGLSLFDLIAEKNKNARMIITNDAGHFHYREHPKEFARNVINFLSNW